jgi:predicted TPR repeat methyltransferase
MSILADKNNCTNDIENYQASDDYITKLFDDFSISFESSLEKLEYHAPSLLVKAIKELNQSTYSLLLDIGCGTGLVGILIAECSNELNIMYSTGVDLSPKMLLIAALKKVNDKKVYNSLYSGGMTTFIDNLSNLRNNKIIYNVADHDKNVINVDDGFDKKFIDRNLLQQYPILVIAADVFVYVGDLDAVFTSLSDLRKNSNNDIFAFTTEMLPEENTSKGFKLQQNGRYCHKKSYLDDLLKRHNFNIVTYKSVVLRKELNNDVHGHLYIVK